MIDSKSSWVQAGDCQFYLKAPRLCMENKHSSLSYKNMVCLLVGGQIKPAINFQREVVRKRKSKVGKFWGDWFCAFESFTLIKHNEMQKVESRNWFLSSIVSLVVTAGFIAYYGFAKRAACYPKDLSSDICNAFPPLYLRGLLLIMALGVCCISEHGLDQGEQLW